MNTSNSKIVAYSTIEKYIKTHKKAYNDEGEMFCVFFSKPMIWEITNILIKELPQRKYMVSDDVKIMLKEGRYCNKISNNYIEGLLNELLTTLLK